MRILLQTSADGENAPRFCRLFLQQDLLGGWHVVRETGISGNRGRVVREHFDDYDDAQSALIRHRDAYSKKGFQVVFVEGARG